ncbi:unnamed protein product [Urochloa decumbens]|uniref:F-box domain-containing protein n=1 Tax=Urochloa decumbens TaxID=240449 RepID=A0ABC8VDJ0_9POAL
MPWTPPPALPNELVEEILLRIPPDDPASLARAALACRRWCGLVADPAFHRRRLALYGATPRMLGFVCDGVWDDDRCAYSRFVPTSSCRPPRADHRGCRAFDARHGRVLLHGRRQYKDFTVWNPITDQLVELPRPPDFTGNSSMKATVLCAAATGACDHLDCHRGPFIVVVVGTNDDLEDVDFDSDGDYVGGSDLDEDDVRDIMHGGFRRVPKEMFACVYSSESGVWSKPTYANHPNDKVAWGRSALVGNTLYFELRKNDNILEYDLGTQKMTVIALPPYPHAETIYALFMHIQLTIMEDGGLGFARLEESNELCLWSRDEGTEVVRDWLDNVTGWTLCKVIDLKKVSPLIEPMPYRNSLVGFMEGKGIAFVAVRNKLFTIDLKSGLMRKVFEGCSIIFCAVPYITFCTPALGASSRDDGPRLSTSSA